jgi:hypothetical protein
MRLGYVIQQMANATNQLLQLKEEAFMYRIASVPEQKANIFPESAGKHYPNCR